MQNQVRCAANALDGAPVEAGNKAGRPAQLGNELVEFWRPPVGGQEQRLFRQQRHRHILRVSESMVLGDEDPERVEAHKLGRDVLRRVRGAPKADVDAAVGEERELFWYACLHLMDLQVTEALLNRAEDLRHGVITRIDDADLQHRGQITCPPCRGHGPLGRYQDLPGLVQERRPRGGQRDMMRTPIEQRNAELPLEPLDLLAESGLSNMLASRGLAEVELLSERDEEPELTELQGAHPLCAWGYIQYAPDTGAFRMLDRAAAVGREDPPNV